MEDGKIKLMIGDYTIIKEDGDELYIIDHKNNIERKLIKMDNISEENDENNHQYEDSDDNLLDSLLMNF